MRPRASGTRLVAQPCKFGSPLPVLFKIPRNRFQHLGFDTVARALATTARFCTGVAWFEWTHGCLLILFPRCVGQDCVWIKTQLMLHTRIEFSWRRRSKPRKASVGGFFRHGFSFWLLKIRVCVRAQSARRFARTA